MKLEGGHITTFGSEGPKNYAYETNTSKTVCKVRGITLNYRTVQKVNFNVMCDMICLRALSDCADTLTVHIPFKIARNTNDKNVVTRREDKDYIGERMRANKKKLLCVSFVALMILMRLTFLDAGQLLSIVFHVL